MGIWPMLRIGFCMVKVQLLEPVVEERIFVGQDPLLAAEALLSLHGCSIDQVPGAKGSTGSVREAAAATALMDCYRRTGESQGFDALVGIVAGGLLQRIRSRLRHFGSRFDSNEVLQDALINIYRYPTRFLASRPGAFAAWSSTIVDNSVRRQLRGWSIGNAVQRTSDLLEQQADTHAREPSCEAEEREQCEHTLSAFGVLLQGYLHAFQGISEREQHVLQMVEVAQMRYAELAKPLGIRPEALEMVVFRARKRVMERMAQVFEPKSIATT